MNIRFLETFVWVARLRSFRLAAERLHATQPAVSQRIAALEADLGVKLLERDRREVRLTREGMQALERFEAVVQLYAQTRRRLVGGSALTPRIRLGVSDVVSLSFLPQLYRLLMEAHGVETVETKVDLPFSHYQALKDGHIDMAVVPASAQGQEVVNVDVCDFAMRWVASPRLSLPQDPIPLAQLPAHPVISYARASLPHRLLEEQLRQAERPTRRLHSVSTLAGVIRLLVEGVGISAVPAAVVQRELDAGLLCEIPVLEPFPDVRVAATYLHAPEDEASRTLVAVVKEAARAYAGQGGQRHVTVL